MPIFARIENDVVAETVELPVGILLSEAFHPDVVPLFVSCDSAEVSQGWSYDGDTFAPPASPPEPTREEKRAAMPNLTARQLRLGLLHLGKLGDVSASIAALQEPEKSQAEIEWDYASEFRRLHPLIVRLIPILGLTDEQVDPVWLEFSQV